jgi:4-hydroxy-3-methylbut-2-enyl diphosphate reductase
MNENENIGSVAERQAEGAEGAQSVQTFEEMLNESMVSLHTGDIVTGTVISIQNGEVLVNLGYKSDGLIQKGQFSNDPEADVESLVKPGDSVEVYVVRVSDGDGNVLLSRKKVSERKDFEALEKAAEEGTPLPGKIIEVVKGGAIALISGVRAFVPSSQASDRFVKDLNEFKGKEFNFTIINYEKGKRRVVAGRRELAAKEAAERRRQALAGLEPGMRVEGKVSRITDFGAFVDLNGADGLIHISRLAWSRVKKVTDVLNVGDEVTAVVNDVDIEKGKVALSLKDVKADPWLSAGERYPEGEIVEGKVVRIVPFGAFVELEDGLDGLVHISQIADRRVNRVEDVLAVGEVVRARVLGVDAEQRRISLSIRAAQDFEEGFGDSDYDYDGEGYEGEDEGAAEDSGEAPYDSE